MTTEEGNKLIAEFEKLEYINVGHVPHWMRNNLPEVHLLYHTSWDWLMTVVEKISKIRFDDNDGFDEIYNYPYLRTFQNHPKVMVRINRYQLYEAETLIEATWQAVVEFIDFENKNK